MPEVLVRDATEQDVPRLVELVLAEAHEARGGAPDRDAVLASVTAALRDPARGRYWLAWDGARACAAVGVTRLWSPAHEAAPWWIQLLFVAPEARGRGLVGRLLDAVGRAAATAGAPELRLHVAPGNARAIRALERHGFAGSERCVLAQPISRSAGASAGWLDDEALWRGFADRTLSPTQWTHAAHVRVAWLHLARYELDEAHLRMRAGILRLNAVHGLVETPQRGYHETLTRVWLVLVRAARSQAAAADSAGVLIQPGLERTAPLRYYSQAHLFSVEARATFVAPDLAPLP